MFQAVNYSCASSKHLLFTLLVRMLQMNLFQDLDERGVGGGGGAGGMLIFVTPYVISTIFGVRES